MDPEFLEADAAAIVIAVVVGLLVLLMLLALRRKRAERERDALELDDEVEPPVQAAPVGPPSKEVFAPLPAPRPDEVAGPERVAEEAKVEEAKVEERPKEVPGEAEADARARAAAKAAAELEVKADAKARARAEADAKAKAEADAKAKAKAEADAKAKAKAEAEADAKAKAKAEAEAEADAKAKAKAEAEAKAEEGPAKTLRDGLGRTRKEGFIAKLGGLFAGKTLDQELVDEVEEVLFTADIGVRTADRLLESVRESLSKKELRDASKVWGVLRDEAAKILADAAEGGALGTPKAGEPFVTMVLGVNGSGKTTSIGKMAHQLIQSGKRVTLIAGDTFRAAAAEQLEHWGRRVGADVYRGKEGADPASVVFDGVRSALAAGADHVLVDTAGRLQTQVNLMEELRKVRRVMGNAIDGAPHEVLMVLDATTGQNAISQAKLFKDATAVTGIILTKLDGTAKGGVVLGVCSELAIPITFVGIGERVADLRRFDPNEFVDELFRAPT